MRVSFCVFFGIATLLTGVRWSATPKTETFNATTKTRIYMYIIVRVLYDDVLTVSYQLLKKSMRLGILRTVCVCMCRIKKRKNHRQRNLTDHKRKQEIEEGEKKRRFCLKNFFFFLFEIIRKKVRNQ